MRRMPVGPVTARRLAVMAIGMPMILFFAEVGIASTTSAPRVNGTSRSLFRTAAIDAPPSSDHSEEKSFG